MVIPGAKFERVPFADAARTYDIGELTNDSVHVEDLFGDAPAYVFIHRGDLRVPGSLELAGEYENQTLFVIEGDLRIDGPLLFRSGWSVPLVVTGAVTARAVLLAERAMLIVGGELVIEGPLVTSLDDAGHLVIHGERFAANGWIDHYGRGTVESRPLPTMSLYFDQADNPNSPQSRHEFHDPVELAAGLDDDDVVLHSRAQLCAGDATTVVVAWLFDDHGMLDTRLTYDALLAGRPILT